MNVRKLLLSIVILCSVAFLFNGCALFHKQTDPGKIKVVVLNFSIPATMKTQKEISGWWFSSKDTYQNANIGEIYADLLSEELSKNPRFEVYPRTGLKYYFGSKLNRLKQKYPNIKKEELDKIMSQISPKDIATELKIDKVITGEIVESKTVHNKAFHWWKSEIETKVKVINGTDCGVAWEKTEYTKKRFLSDYGIAELNARKVAKGIKKHI